MTPPIEAFRDWQQEIHANALAEGKTDKKEIDPVGFVQALVRIVPTIFKHQRFNECTENRERSTAHMMVLFSFIGLFVVIILAYVGVIRPRGG